jgi:uncharacterized protein YaiI (UPF0178 family)
MLKKYNQYEIYRREKNKVLTVVCAEGFEIVDDDIVQFYRNDEIVAVFNKSDIAGFKMINSAVFGND